MAHDPYPFARRELPVLVAIALMATPAAAAVPPGLADPLRAARVSFEPNLGQFRPELLYVARGVDGLVDVRAGEIVVTPRTRDATFHVRFSGSNPAPEIEAEDPLATSSRYYLGNTARMARESVPHSGRVRMKDLYPGVDLVLHANPDILEIDFIVAPGADPAQVRYDLSQAEGATIDANGDLAVVIGGRTLRHRAPFAYQEQDGMRVPVPARFTLSEGEVLSAGFELGAYDPARKLVIDPVLDYATFLGGVTEDRGGYIGIDVEGKVYIAGTRSANGAAIEAPGSVVTITKFDPATRAVLFNTYLGASVYQEATSLAMGSSGDTSVYVSGFTNSPDFPYCFSGGDCRPYKGGDDAFVVRVSTSTGDVRSSWLLGGSGDDVAYGVAADAAGNVFVTGQTTADFPTTNFAPNQVNPSGVGDPDAFMARLHPANGIAFSTYLGASGDDAGYAIDVDAIGQVYVGGRTDSLGFPRGNSVHFNRGAFVTSFWPQGPNSYLIAYSTTFGVSGDAVRAVRVNPLDGGRLVIAGRTTDPAFPQVGRVDAVGGGGDAFVAQLEKYGPFRYSTRIGGAGEDGANAVAIGQDGAVYVAGSTTSANFPVVAPLTSPSVQGGSLHGTKSAFVARLDATHSQLQFSTYLGGSGSDTALSLAATAGGVLVGGNTTSANFPTTNAFRATSAGASDWFVARIGASMPVMRADFNGDGRSDLVWQHADGRAALWPMNGLAPMAPREIIGPATGWSVVQVADLNGDGKADLAWQHTDRRVVLYLMDGTNPTATQEVLGPGNWVLTHAADLNGDGKADLLFRNLDGTIVAWTMNGTAMAGSATLLGAASGWSVLKTGDFDGDGKDDILWRHTDGQLAIWLMDGLQLKAGAIIAGAGLGWTVSHVADLNGDGKADLVFRHDDGSVAAWLMNGASVASTRILFGAGTGWSVTHTGDLNGDGKADLVWKYVDGSAAVWLMDGLVPTATAGIIGAGGWSVKRVQDLNGDGKADLVWQHTDGSVVAWLMNGTSFTSTAGLLGSATGWGVSSSNP